MALDAPYPTPRRARPALPARRARLVHALRRCARFGIAGLAGVVIALASGLGGLAGWAVTTAGAVTTASATTTAATSIGLVSQTTFVDSSGLTLRVSIDSPLPSSALALQVVLYSRLTNLDDFEASLSDPAADSSVLTSTTVPLSQLPASELSTKPGAPLVATFTLPVTPGYPSGSNLALQCGTAQCDGVYPMQVQLRDNNLGRQVLGGFITYLVYDAAENGTYPLDVGIVLPVGTAPALSSSGANEISSVRLGELYGMVQALERRAAVPVTLDVYPQLVLALERDRDPRAAAVLAALRQLDVGQASNGTPEHELLAAPFTPVDPSVLAASGLGGDLARQLQRGAAILDQAVGSTQAGTFVLNGGLDPAGLALLTGAGIHQLVVRTADLSGNPADGTYDDRFSLLAPAGTSSPSNASTSLASAGVGGASGTSGATGAGTSGAAGAGASGATGTGTGTGTATGTGAAGAGASGQDSTTTVSPGNVASGSNGTAGVDAFADDPGATAIFARSRNDPALAAHQLLAELAFIFYEAPGEQSVRAVVVAPPAWAESTLFLQTLLSGLEAESGGPTQILEGATMAQLSSLPEGAGGAAASVRLVSSTPQPPPGLAHLVQSARHSVDVLTSIVPSDAAERTTLLDAVLMSESTGLAGAQRRAYAGTAGAAVAAEGRELTISAGTKLTLTSRCGSLPITIDSAARSEVYVVLRLSSSVGFSCGRSKSGQLVAVHGNAEVTLHIGARAAGEAPLVIDLDAPEPGSEVVLASTQIGVVSTAFSPVAIALSIGALVVLAAWWVRSSQRRRRSRSRVEPATDSGVEPAAEG